MPNSVPKKIISTTLLASLIVVIIITSTGPLNLLQAQESKSWTVEFTHSGIYSSPRVADLNLDGTKDIIVGTGRHEFEKTDSAVVALDGATGELLWHVGARDQIFGSATLLDINQDSIPDVLIGGRSAELKAINGKTGEVIWEYFKESDDIKPSSRGLYNFYNPQIIPDQNNDGLPDILVSNGGDVNAAPDDPNRPPGQLMIIDAKRGTLLASAQTPDGKETYMSVIVSKIHDNQEELTIIFGTGGETVGGNLYRTTLGNLKNQNISDAIVLDSSKNKGYIAPPVLSDINRDGYYDVVSNAVEGKIVAIDGKTNTRLWSNKIDSSEAYGSIAVGFFNNDSIPDFFTTFTKGVWPNLHNSKQLMVDGETGNIIFNDSLGVVQTSSPVVADFNNDGFDDGLMSINFTIMKKKILKFYNNMLVVFDFHNNSTYQLTNYFSGINLASTPWLGDLDSDGKLDIIFCSLTEDRNIFAMDGFRITRFSTDIELSKPVRWGAYMGSDYTGIFRKFNSPNH